VIRALYDIAEALFGYIDKGDPNRHKQGDKCRAYASRVSVSDAVVESAQGDFYEAEFVPKVLGGPKPTTFQHYLEQPREAYKEKSKLHHYATVPRPKIRGHKRYWLQRIKGIDSVRETDTSKYGDTQHTRMKPVKAGITFKFTVCFENLSDVELGALAWALYLPCSPEHRHQLGMGKPYGMGMVKLEPTLHVIDRQARYTQLFDGDRWATAEREESAEQFIAAFEKYIADKAGKWQALPRPAAHLRAERHAHAASADKKFTYMTIEPENEYKDRPVLPRPSEVIGSACSGDAPSKSAALSVRTKTGYKVGDVAGRSHR
jgi:CRISPR-associated protein (TIGR03986 family)